ncbi:MAG: SPFH domain-containing protein [Caulobacteraceae bacterium]|nr:SPFH domain-containing protein [Caulobacteraceae bacterium]
MTEARNLNATREHPASTMNGGLMLLLCVIAFGAAIWLVATGGRADDTPLVLGGSLTMFLAIFLLCGFYAVQPNQAVVLTLFGNYKGTDRKTGLRWVLPWLVRKKVSTRVRNVTSDKLKVNDKRGNPIEIAANVVWRVQDSAQASFDVEDYAVFVNIQIDSGLRAIASHYAYDHGEEHEPTLRAEADLIAERLKVELEERVAVAGLTIDEVRLAHLAYAPEIAGAMLRRQQAEAILAARRLIVLGAVGMVETALQSLSERGVVELDEERKAAMVSNLLVVLCGDRDAQPVVNTGTLYG